jgi:hypothetical protein
MRQRTLLAAAVLSAALITGGCAGTKEVVTIHPAGDGKPPVCTECHDTSRAPLDHLPDFGRSHEMVASVSGDSCLLCHRRSSCAVCHANSTGMNPAERLRGRPDLDVPHRGDWVTRHRIEGKINPASCATCHARRDNGRCRTCHR